MFQKEEENAELCSAALFARARLLKAVPVEERRINLAGIATTVLEGGSGPPLILLHGPAESAANWMRVIPELVKTHRVIAPDLPGHGSSAPPQNRLDAPLVLAWLDALIAQSCSSRPVLVGHVLGGAIAARFAVAHSERLEHLVLVDSLGLAPFRPSVRFALSLVHFMARPTDGTYARLMRQCSSDLDALRYQMATLWEPFAAYNIALARMPSVQKSARSLMKEVGMPPVAPPELARITVPTALLWGREDRALRLEIAESAHRRFGWPLFVIDDCADDPARDQPEAFLTALYTALGHRAAAAARQAQ